MPISMSNRSPPAITISRSIHKRDRACCSAQSLASTPTPLKRLAGWSTHPVTPPVLPTLANHELASSCTRFLGSSNLMDLDEVTARIIEDGHGCHSHVCWLHRKLHTQRFQSGILFLNVVNLKCRERYPIRKQRLFERFHCRVISVCLKKPLGAVQL